VNNLYQTYFARVRWVELAWGALAAFFGKLQLSANTGKPLNSDAYLEAAGVSVMFVIAFLRVPKAPDAESEAADIDFAALPPGSLPDGIDATGPAHDVKPDAVEAAISSILPPIVAAAAPDLAKNITQELGRVLKRGIRF
jgi:hypothetical protein